MGWPVKELSEVPRGGTPSSGLVPPGGVLPPLEILSFGPLGPDGGRRSGKGVRNMVCIYIFMDIPSTFKLGYQYDERYIL